MRRVCCLLLLALSACGDDIADRIAGLASLDPDVRDASWQALYEAGPAVVPRLEAALEAATNLEQQLQLQELLSSYTADGLIARLHRNADFERTVAWLVEVDPDRSGPLLGALGEGGAFAAVLGGWSEEERRAAFSLLLALLRAGRREVHAALDEVPVEELVALLVAAEHPTVRQGISIALIRRKVEAPPLVEGLLGHAEPAVRVEGLRLAEAFWGETTPLVPLIRTLAAEDADAETRRAALVLLVSQRDPEAGALLRAALADPAPAVRRAAVVRYLRIGPEPEEAVPLLAARLADADSEIPGRAAAALGTLGFEAEGALPALHARLEERASGLSAIECLEALRAIGPAWAPESPSRAPVCRLLGDWLARGERSDGRVLATLAALGAPGVSELVRALEAGPEPGFRAALCQTLGDLGPAAAPALPVLERLLEQGNGSAAVDAAGAILKIEPTHARARDLALAALDGSTGWSRLEALDVLSALRSAPAPAQAALRRWLDEELFGRRVFDVLAGCGPDSATLRAFAVRAGGEDVTLRTWIEELYPTFGAAGVPFLLEELECADPRRRTALLLLLARCAPSTPEASAVLLAEAPNATGKVRNALFGALPGLGVPEQVLPVLLAAFPDWAAYTALHALGPEAAPAVPELLGLWADHPAHGYKVLTILAAIGPAAAEALPALRAELRGRTDLALEVLEALAAIGPAAAPAVPLLIPYLDSEERALPQACAALAAIGSVADEELRARVLGRLLDLAAHEAGGPALRAAAILAPDDAEVWRAASAALEADTVPLRRAAIEALGRISTPDRVERLVAIVERRNRGDVDEALRSLAAIGPAAAGVALPALIELLRYSRRRYGPAAADAAAALVPAPRPARLEKLIERGREVADRR